MQIWIHLRIVWYLRTMCVQIESATRQQKLFCYILHGKFNYINYISIITIIILTKSNKITNFHKFGFKLKIKKYLRNDGQIDESTGFSDSPSNDKKFRANGL
jgi:hypothetical protein